MSDTITAGSSLDIIAKVDEERRLVLGWLNVNKVAGQYVIDRQGDVIPDRELKTPSSTSASTRVLAR